ncbi:hypothetical protein QCE62_00310 [Caballeronia sp. LZ033]|uniref:hypothetical protein n=1 Tax=Caballeronia sp. LZ033 TaxID=3038566 RepID=UPI0028583CC2|nr:hypothetical protein [Caballeronia sp. LZ033]MDR5812030.1 hypothetical protein [Caballeronia sp. LZ033]
MTQIDITLAINDAANHIIANDLDYADHADLPEGYTLAAHADGVWIVDARFTCNMDDMPRIVRVINAPLWGRNLIEC